jgi:3-phytase
MNPSLILSSALLAMTFVGCSHKPRAVDSAPRYPVTATVETDAVANAEDAADDPAIWVHPTKPEASLIVGTDKNRKAGGLHLYTLDGKSAGFLADPGLNNVDLRQNVPNLGKAPRTVVAATRRTDNTLAIYALEGETRTWTNIEAKPRVTINEVYGFCLYQSRKSGLLFAFVPDKAGGIHQYRLDLNDQGMYRPERVRVLKVKTQAEGCVADDVHGNLFVGEEDFGLWKYAAEPDAPTTGTLLDSLAPGHLVDDVEGIALTTPTDSTGYLYVSSQGENAYAVYDRKAPHAYRFSFKINDGGKDAQGRVIDGTYDTDGIDVTAQPLGPLFPQGVFVAQDGNNTDGADNKKQSTQNFKLVPLESVMQFLNPAK